jgi:hypothetical protein
MYPRRVGAAFVAAFSPPRLVRPRGRRLFGDRIAEEAPVTGVRHPTLAARPQAAEHDPAPAGLADWNLLRGLPEIELADLSPSIDRALKRSRRIKQRPHLTQIVIDDRLAAIERLTVPRLKAPSKNECSTTERRSPFGSRRRTR